MSISGRIILFAAMSYLATWPVAAEPLRPKCDAPAGQFLLAFDSGCGESSAFDSLYNIPQPVFDEIEIDLLPDSTTVPGSPAVFRDYRDFEETGLNHSWGSFLDFVSGRTEETAKMKDPYYRHRYPEVSSNWKRLFYQKTPYYYRKGIEFIHLKDGLIRVSLVKQKMNYNELIKGLWTEKAYDMVLESNEGWLRNRAIFGGGRSYFLELSFHFE